MEVFVTRYGPSDFESQSGACAAAMRTGGVLRGLPLPISLALGVMGLFGSLLAPRAVLGGGSADSPGQTVVSVVRHKVVDLPTLNQKVDPTDKVTAEEYWHVLSALKSLRAGTACTALSVKQREAAAKLGLDCKNVSLVELLPYRDDPLYAVDESRPLGPVQLDGQGKPKCRDCPLVAVELTKLPYEIQLTDRFISVNSTTETEKTTYGFRVVVPLYRRKPEGDLGPEPVRLRFPLLTEAPGRGSRSVCAPVTESGDLVEMGAAAPGGTASPSVLYRRGYSAADQLVFFDNSTNAGRAATLGRKRITTYDIAQAATMVPGTSMARGVDGEPVWNLGDGWGVRKDLQLYQFKNSRWELVPGPPELPTNAVAEDGTPIWVLGDAPRGQPFRGVFINAFYSKVAVAPDGTFYGADSLQPNRFRLPPAGWGRYNDAAWASALVNHNLAGHYVIRPTPKARVQGAPLNDFPSIPLELNQCALMGTDSAGTDGRAYLAWPDPANPDWGISPEGRLYFRGSPHLQASDPPSSLFFWAVSFGVQAYRGTASPLPPRASWSIDRSLQGACVTRLKAVLAFFYDWGDRQAYALDEVHNGSYTQFPTTTMAYFLRPSTRQSKNVYAQAITHARTLGISLSSPLPRFLVHPGYPIYSPLLEGGPGKITPIAGFDGIILLSGREDITIDLSGAQSSGVLIWSYDNDPYMAECISNGCAPNVVRFTGSGKLGLRANIASYRDLTYVDVPAGTPFEACVGAGHFTISGRDYNPHGSDTGGNLYGTVGGAYTSGCR